MQELTVKEVNFNGDTLLALENKGKIFVGVKWICDGLGLSKGQSDNQVK